jgi:hypothetical protein
MRLSLLLLIIALCKVSAIETYAQITRISLSMRDASVKEVLRAIEKKSEFAFFYNDDAIDTEQKVSVNVTNRLIGDILSEILPDCMYQVDNRKIILIPKPAPAISAETNGVTQQGKRITGSVIDVAGDPLAGASVMEKGTTNGTVTDTDGNFSLTVTDKATLQVSYIGYITQEISDPANLVGGGGGLTNTETCF